MTTVTAVITTSALREALAGLLPSRPKAIVRSPAHVYRVYCITVSGRFHDYTFVDPTDGGVLVRCNYFDDELTAHRWIDAEVLRTAETEGVQ